MLLFGTDTLLVQMFYFITLIITPLKLIFLQDFFRLDGGSMRIDGKVEPGLGTA